ncbi:MAG TPA: phosphotransferase [Streptosporangiaceae bacterium]
MSAATGVGAMSAATAAAVAASYQLGAPVADPVFAARGEQGLVWRLDTRDGSWAVKELLLPVAEADAVRDVAFQLAALAAGLPLPRPCHTRDGRVVLPAGEAAATHSVRVYEWAALAAGSPAATAAEIGAVTARLHRLGHTDGRPVEAWFSEPLGEPGWQALHATASRAGAPWARALGRWLPELIALDGVAAPPDPAQLTTCHRDLNTENVLRAAGGGTVVLDWENCGPAQLERELALILSDLAVDVSLAAAAAAHHAYQAAAGPARLTGASDFATAVAVQGHLLEFYSRRALDPAESAQNAARSRGRLDRMLRQPLTRSRVSRLLRLLARRQNIDGHQGAGSE